MQEITRRANDIEESPATTLDIIGQPRSERYWEQFLVYFLDKNNPHGFETDVLEAFLKAVCSHPGTTLSDPILRLDQVEIQTQVPTGRGPFDVLLWLKDEWFICLELKVDSPETNDQTVRYAESPQLGDLIVDRHRGIGEYAYLAPESAPPSVAGEFVDISWSHVVSFLDTVLVDGFGKYPAKSSSQFADYLHTIKRELNMTDISKISEETKLYSEYAETIERLKNSHESDKKRLFRSIQDAFFREFDSEREEWIANNGPRGYIQFYKPEWRGVGSGVNIEYEPHVHLDKERPDIHLRLDIESGDKQDLRESLLERLDQDQVGNQGWEITDGSFEFVSKTVPLDFDTPQESVRHAVRELFEFHALVGPHIEELVKNHSTN